MEIVTSTELRRDSVGAYNKVQKFGKVEIKHRDRPPMVLITVEELNKIRENREEK